MSIFDNLTNAQEQSTQLGNQDSGGGFSHKNFWEDIKDKDGNVIELWKPEIGDNYFDIMPWIPGTNLFGQLDKGAVFDIQLDVHMKMGTGKQTEDVLSRAGLGFPDDPIQDEQKRLFEKANSIAEAQGIDKKSTKEWKKALSLYPKKRSLYLILVHNEDGTKTPKLFSPAYNTFGKLLEKKKRLLEKQGETVIWAHPTLGKTIYLECEETTFTPPGGTPIKFPGYDAVECINRAKPYPESIIDRMPQLDTYLKVPTADDCYKALFGTSAPVEEDEDETITAEDLSTTPSGPSLNLPPSNESVNINDAPADAGPSTDFEDDLPF